MAGLTAVCRRSCRRSLPSFISTHAVRQKVVRIQIPRPSACRGHKNASVSRRPGSASMSTRPDAPSGTVRGPALESPRFKASAPILFRTSLLRHRAERARDRLRCRHHTEPPLPGPVDPPSPVVEALHPEPQDLATQRVHALPNTLLRLLEPRHLWLGSKRRTAQGRQPCQRLQNLRRQPERSIDEYCTGCDTGMGPLPRMTRTLHPTHLWRGGAVPHNAPTSRDRDTSLSAGYNSERNSPKISALLPETTQAYSTAHAQRSSRSRRQLQLFLPLRSTAPRVPNSET